MSAVFKKLPLKGCCWSLVTLALSNRTPQIGRMVDAPMFNCPNCNGLYHVVKVEAPPIMNEAQLTCLSCGGPLNARRGALHSNTFLSIGDREKPKLCRPV